MQILRILCKLYINTINYYTENRYMKIGLLLYILLGLIFIGCGSGQETGETSWYTYGAEITESEVMSVTHAVNQLGELFGKTVVIEGKIKQVCQSRGCWMVVEENGISIRVRFADYGFFVPWESAGKSVRMQGILNRETVSEDRARHWAEEADDPDVKPGDIYGDQEIITLMATAVSIHDGTPISEQQKAVIDGDEDHSHTH